MENQNFNKQMDLLNSLEESTSYSSKKNAMKTTKLHEELNELFKSGALSKEEFEKAKAKLLEN